MRDTELLLRYYAFKNFLPEYSGTLKKFLDDSCKTLNKKWPENSNKIIEQLESFEQSHLFIKSVFKDNKYRKWSGSTYESRFNRAVFDILILSFDNPEVRNKAAGKESQIEDLYKALCNNNKDFMKSIESTTKSLTATQTRFSAWFNSLNNLLGSNLQAPNLIETNTN